MKIEAQFAVEIPETDEDYPDQAAEMKVDLMSRALTSFVRRVADNHSDSIEEGHVIIWSIAMDLLASFQGNACGDLLRRRMDSRYRAAKIATPVPIPKEDQA